MKFYGGEDSPPAELLADFEENGLEASRLRREGKLLMRPEEEPLRDSREDALARILEEEGEKGEGTMGAGRTAVTDGVNRVPRAEGGS